MNAVGRLTLHWMEAHALLLAGSEYARRYHSRFRALCTLEESRDKKVSLSVRRLYASVRRDLRDEDWK